jgi:hypothetical protein
LDLEPKLLYNGALCASGPERGQVALKTGQKKAREEFKEVKPIFSNSTLPVASANVRLAELAKKVLGNRAKQPIKRGGKQP